MTGAWQSGQFLVLLFVIFHPRPPDQPGKRVNRFAAMNRLSDLSTEPGDVLSPYWITDSVSDREFVNAQAIPEPGCAGLLAGAAVLEGRRRRSPRPGVLL